MFTTKFLQFFSENKSIEMVAVSESVLEDVSNRTIDYKIVRSLNILNSFEWNNSEINETQQLSFKAKIILIIYHLRTTRYLS